MKIYPKIPGNWITPVGDPPLADHAQNRPEGWAPTEFAK
jgi:hypothetical protein